MESVFVVTLSENIKEIKQEEKFDLCYDNIVKKEKKLSWIITFGIPIPMFTLLVIIAITNNLKLMSAAILPIVIICAIIFSFIFLRTDRTKYPRFKPIKSASVFFTKLGYERMVIRWKIWSNLTSNYVQFLIFISVLVALMVSTLSLVKTHTEIVELTKNFFYSLLIVPTIMLYIPFLFRSILTAHDDFGQCYSIGCLRIVERFKELDDIKKTNFIIESLKYYDGYIRKTLKLRINNFETFHSLILKDSKESMDELAQIMLAKLEKGEKLDLLRYLISQSVVSPDKPFLVSEKISDKMKNSYQIIISVASLIIAVIQIAK